MSNLSDELKKDEVEAAEMLERILMAGLLDAVAKVPSAYQPFVAGIEAAAQPAIKSFLDAQIAKLAGQA